RPEAACRWRSGAARLPATGHGCLLPDHPGLSQRACRQEPAVQEDQGEPRRVYEGSALLHADRGELLRQLSAQQDAQGLSERPALASDKKSPGDTRAARNREVSMNKTAEVVATVGVAVAALTGTASAQNLPGIAVIDSSLREAIERKDIPGV